MEVILNKDMDNLGKSGSIVKVKEGFARNFLIPNKLAIPLTPQNLKRLEQEKIKVNLGQEKLKNEAQDLKNKLEALSLTLPALTQEEDKLYGSIGANDVAEALKDEGIEVNKNFILLDEPIKAVGIYEIPVKLHQEVVAKLKVWIVKK